MAEAASLSSLEWHHLRPDSNEIVSAEGGALQRRFLGVLSVNFLVSATQPPGRGASFCDSGAPEGPQFLRHSSVPASRLSQARTLSRKLACLSQKPLVCVGSRDKGGPTDPHPAFVADCTLAVWDDAPRVPTGAAHRGLDLVAETGRIVAETGHAVAETGQASSRHAAVSLGHKAITASTASGLNAGALVRGAHEPGFQTRAELRPRRAGFGAKTARCGVGA